MAVEDFSDPMNLSVDTAGLGFSSGIAFLSNATDPATISVPSLQPFRFQSLEVSHNIPGFDATIEFFAAQPNLGTFGASLGTVTVASGQTKTFSNTANVDALGIQRVGGGDNPEFDNFTYSNDVTSPGFSNGPSVTVGIPENTTPSNFLDVQAGDDGTANPDTGVTYALGGLDAGAGFSIDASSGRLALSDPKDFENPPSDNLDNVYDLTVTATDDVGNAATQNITVTITDVNEAPTLSADARSLNAIPEDDTANTGTAVASILASAGTSGDPEDDTLGIAVTGVTDNNGTYAYSTDLGDSWTDVGDATPSDTSALILEPDDLIRFEPDADFAGSATGSVTFRAWDQSVASGGATGVPTDGGGGTTGFSSTTATASATVIDAPEVTAITRGGLPGSSPTNAATVTFDVMFSEPVSGIDASDVELTGTGTAIGFIDPFSANGTATVTVTVDFVGGDGELRLDVLDDGTITSDAASIPLGGIGSGGAGDGSFSGGEGYVIDTTPPMLSDDAFTVDEDDGNATVLSDLRANDTDNLSTSGALTVTAVDGGFVNGPSGGSGGSGGFGVLFDDGGEGGNFGDNVGSSVTGSNGGHFTVTADGRVDFDPNGAFERLAVEESTTSSVVVLVADEAGNEAIQSVTATIIGENDAPTALADSASTDEDSALSVPAADGVIQANDTDVDAGDSLAVTRVQESAAGVGTAVAGDSGGRFTIASDGSYGFDPSGDFDDLGLEASRDTSVVYTVADGNGGTDTANLRITVNGQNDPPRSLALESSSVNQSSGTNGEVGRFSTRDPDSGDTHSYALVAGRGDDDNAAFNIDGSRLRATDAAELAPGSYSVRVRTADGNGGTREETFTVSVRDDVAPSLVGSNPSDGSTTLATGDDLSLTFDEPVVLGAGTIRIVDEADGSSTRELDVSGDRVSVAGNTVTLDPAGDLAPLTAYHVTVAPGAIADVNGNAFVGGGFSSPGVLNFATSDFAFNELGPTSVTVLEDASVDLTSALAVSDLSPSDTLTWTVTAAPSNGALAGVDGVSENVVGSGSPHTLSSAPSYTPDPDFHDGGMPDDSFDVTVTDIDPGMSDTITVHVTVEPVNDAPSFTLPADPDVAVGNDTEPQVVSGFIDTAGFAPGPNEDAQGIRAFAVVNDDPALFATGPAIAADGELTFTPADGIQGTASVAVRVVDDGGTANGGEDTSAAQRFAIAVDNLAPAVVGARVDGDALTLQLSEAMATGSGATPAAGDFTVAAGGGAVGVDSLAYSDAATLTFALDTAVGAGATVTLGYQPGTDAARDAAGNPLGAFAGQSVANTTIAPCRPPTADDPDRGGEVPARPAGPLFDGPADVTVSEAVNPGLAPTSAFENTRIDGAPATTATTTDRFTGASVDVLAVGPVAEGRRVDDDPASPDVDVDVGSVRASFSESLGLIAATRTVDDRADLAAVIERGSAPGGEADGGDLLAFLDAATNGCSTRDVTVTELIPTPGTADTDPADGDRRITVDAGTAALHAPTLTIVNLREVDAEAPLRVDIAGSGNVVVRGGAAFAGTGDPAGDGASDTDNVVGDGSDQAFFFGPGDDTIRGRGGDDSVASAGGDDRLFGGSGDDTVSGGTGDDRLVGGPGADVLTGDAGADRLVADAGDRLVGGPGGDIFDLTQVVGEATIVRATAADRFVFRKTDIDPGDLTLTAADPAGTSVLRVDRGGNGRTDDDALIVFEGVRAPSFDVADRAEGGTTIAIAGPSRDKLFFRPDGGLSVGRNADVFGRTGGEERVFLAAETDGVRLDANIERLDIDRPLATVSFQVTGDGLTIAAGESTVATIPSLNQTMELRLGDGRLELAQTSAARFDVTGDGANPVPVEIGGRLDGIGLTPREGIAVAPDAATDGPAASVFLGPDGTFAAAQGAEVFGRAGGAERVVVGRDVAGVELDANVERLEIGRLADDLDFRVTADGLDVSTGETVLVTLPSLNQPMELRFADGNATLSQIGAEQFNLVGGAGGEIVIGAERTTVDVDLGRDVAEMLDLVGTPAGTAPVAIPDDV